MHIVLKKKNIGRATSKLHHEMRNVDIGCEMWVCECGNENDGMYKMYKCMNS